jgi:hypothetical protein
MYIIPMTPAGALVRRYPAERVERTNAPRFVELLTAPLEKRTLFRLIPHVPAPPEDFSQVPEDYGLNLIEYQEYEVEAMTFYCNSIAWDGDPATRDETGDGTKENPWRNVNYALERLQTSLDCSQDSMCCRPIYQLRIKGTINYTVGKQKRRDWHQGYGRLILDVWQEEETDPDKWEVAYATVDFAGVTSFAGTYLYNCHVHDLEFAPKTSYSEAMCYGIYFMDDTYTYPSALHGCRVSDLHTYGRREIYGILLNSSAAEEVNPEFSLMAYDCHASNLTSECDACGMWLSPSRSNDYPVLALDCSVKNVKSFGTYEVLISNVYGMIVSRGSTFSPSYFSRCEVSDITAREEALGFDGENGLKGVEIYMADCHVENVSAFDNFRRFRAYGFYLKNPHLYHCSAVNISGWSSIGFYLKGRKGRTGESADTGIGGEVYYCQASEIFAIDNVLGMDAGYLTVYGFECSAVSSSESVVYGIRGNYCFLISCRAVELSCTHHAVCGIYTGSYTQLYDCSVENCICYANDSRSYKYVYGINLGRNNSLYDCRVSNLAGSSNSTAGVYVYGVYLEDDMNTVVDGCVISDVQATARSAYNSALAEAIGFNEYNYHHDNTGNTNIITNVGVSNISALASCHREGDYWTEYQCKIDSVIGEKATGCDCVKRYLDQYGYQEEDRCEIFE